MPILNMTPLLGLYHLTDAAEETHFTKEYLEYDFSPLTIKMVKSQNDELLKPIKSEFAPMRNDEDGNRGAF